MAFAADKYLCSARSGVTDQVLDLHDSRIVDKGTLSHPLRGARPHNKFGDRSHKLLREACGHRGMNEDPVSADTCLAACAKLGSHQSLDGGIDISILKDDERSVTPQFHRDALHRGGAVGDELFANLRRAGEAEFSDNWVRCEGVADRGSPSRQHREETMRKPGAKGQHCKC